jgi:hypothetical protein
MRPSRLKHLRALRGLLLSTAVLCFCSFHVLAQNEPASVTFKFDFPGAEPNHYVVSVSADGHASYDSNGKLSLQSEVGDPYHFDFIISESTRARVFDLAQRAHYFAGKIDSGKKNLANTGTKVLIYTSGDKTNQATYNYSPIQAVQDLTAIFQQLSMTLEFGRRLDYYRHYQKTALDEELKSMEQQSMENALEEVSAVAPILQQIATDSSLMNVVRARAQRLLAAPAK